MTAEPDHEAAYIGPGARDPGAWNQVGVVVLHRRKMAFLPTQPPTHLAAIAAKAAFAAGGVLIASLGGTAMSREQLIARLQQLSGDDLEALLPGMVAELGGVIWGHGDAEYFHEKLPLGVRLSFLAPGDRVMALKVALASPAFAAQTRDWPQRPPPKKRNLKPLWITLGVLGGLVALIVLVAVLVLVGLVVLGTIVGP